MTRLNRRFAGAAARESPRLRAPCADRNRSARGARERAFCEFVWQRNVDLIVSWRSVLGPRNCAVR
eukprot:2811568-Lingulodinium_polyedra.AAC.1